MSDTKEVSRFTPERWQTVTPRIVVEGVPELVEFLQSVFDATGAYTADRPTVMKIGSSMVMISEPAVRKPMPAFLYVYVDDADEKYRRASMPARLHSRNHPTCLTAIDAEWSKIGGVTCGKLPRTTQNPSTKARIGLVPRLIMGWSLFGGKNAAVGMASVTSMPSDFAISRLRLNSPTSTCSSSNSFLN